MRFPTSCTGSQSVSARLTPAVAVSRFPTYCPGGTQPEGFTVDYSTINVEYITIDGTPLKWNCAGKVPACLDGGHAL